MKALCTLLIALAVTAQLGAMPAADKTGPAPSLVASTTWTAAFALAAGADPASLRVLAPADLRHPPEYELLPSDVLAVQKARVVLYAGYERFAKRIAETSASPGVRLVVIKTDNALPTIMEQTRIVAEALGSLPAWQSWSAGFDLFAAETQKAFQTRAAGRPVVVQKLLVPFVQWLGLNIAGTFGPGEPSPALTAELALKKPALVIDNFHNPNGAALAQAAGVPRCLLLNFPGQGGTRSFESLYQYNLNEFSTALSPAP